MERKNSFKDKPLSAAKALISICLSGVTLN
jgi:hypothetical protein